MHTQVCDHSSPHMVMVALKSSAALCALTSDSSGQLNVLWHDGDSLGMDGTQVGVFEQADHVGFGSLLQGLNGRGLESQFGLVVGGNLSDQALEGSSSDQ